jgi:DNA-binding winged helix-turn-helix (wHTH) protein
MVPNDRSVRFSGFGFDPDTGEVTRDGTTGVRLQEQPARVLERLTSRAGQLVTRDELHRLLWPENSLVDADNGLNIAINKIRLALDDSAGQPRFIQTVPRRGYRFIGTLEPSNPAVAPPPRSSRSTKAIWTGVSVFGLLIVSLVVFTSWRSTTRCKG